MVNDLYHTHRKKTKLALPTSNLLDNFSDTLNLFPTTKHLRLKTQLVLLPLHLSMQNDQIIFV